MSKLYFTFGPMGCSKSTNALIIRHNYISIGKNVLMLKPAVDTRDGAYIVSRAINTKVECTLVDKDTNLFDLISNKIANKECDIVIVDEAQFLTSRQVEHLKNVVVQKDIHVFCFGLLTNYMTTLFEGSKRLVELADSLRENKMVCHCGHKATINALIINGKIIKKQLGENDVEMGDIKHQEKKHYSAMCYECYTKENFNVSEDRS